MNKKRYSRMTNHYGTSRTYCTGVYDNQNNREFKGVKGELYPCKPDVFEMTYEKVIDDDRE